MSGRYWCVPRFYDASALVKLVADDEDEKPGQQALRDDYWSHTASVYATPYCIAEAFKVFERKRDRERVTQAQYLRYLRDFRVKFLGLNLRQEAISILPSIVTTETERLDTTYKIGFVDCFQIATLRHGRFRVLGPNSQAILITADRGLAKAARAEGAKVWECTREPAPGEVIPSDAANFLRGPVAQLDKPASF
jgi:predicted nucleic acid-binding protein